MILWHFHPRSRLAGAALTALGLLALAQPANAETWTLSSTD